MKHSDSIKELALALHKAQTKIKAAVKDSTNPHFRSKYADLSSVVEAVKVHLNDAGIVFLQGVSGVENGVAVETRLLHVSGEWIASTLEIPASKHDAQGYGSAITYGRRYGLQAMCGVPAEDDDGNAATASAPHPLTPKRAITPNGGAGEDLDAEQRKMVDKTVEEIVKALDEGRDFDAYGLCESFTDEMLAEKLYCWSKLDSKQRRRLKTQAEKAKQPKAA